MGALRVSFVDMFFTSVIKEDLSVLLLLPLTFEVPCPAAGVKRPSLDSHKARENQKIN